MAKQNNSKKEQDEKLENWDYPPQEDIYANEQEVHIDENGEIIDDNVTAGQEDTLDMDLDVPGSELDDAQQEIGSEDEENNYWS